MPSEDVLLRMKLDTGDFASKLKEINSGITDAKNAFDKATSGMKNWSGNADGLKAKLEQLSTTHKLLADKVDVCKQKLESAKSALSNSETNADTLKQKLEQLAQQGYDETSDEVQQLKAELEKTNSTIDQQKNVVSKCEQELTKAETAVTKNETAQQKYAEKLVEVNEKAKEAESAHAKLKAEIDKQESALEKAKNKYKDLVIEQKEGTQEAQELKQEIQRLSDELNTNKDRLKAAEDATEQLGNKQEGAKGKLSGLKDAFTEGLSSADLFTGGLEGMAIALGQKVIQGLQDAARAVFDFGKQCVETGMTFDKSMSTVAATAKMDTTSQAFTDLRNKALEMGSTTQFSASQAADAFNYMAMAGWDSEQMISGIPGVLNLAAASGEELATTSDIVTDGLTAFGLAASDAGHFSDVLAAASSSANTNVSMMGESFKYVGPVAGAMGYSIEDVSVALGLMANSGVKASSAGTSLRSLMTRLASPTAEVSTAMEQLGISIDDGEGNMLSFMDVMTQLRTGFSECKMPTEEFTNLLSDYDNALASGAITQEDYNKGVESLMERAYGAEGALKAQAASALAGKTGMAGLLAIVNASDEDFEKLTNEIYNCNGAAEKMAKTANDNLAGDLTIAQSAIEGLQIAISDKLTPVLRPVVQLFSEMVSWLAGILTGTTPLSPLFGILGDTWNAVCEVIRVAWDSTLQPVFDFFIDIVKRVVDEFSEHTPMIMDTWNALCTAIKTVWEGVLKPVFDVFKEVVVLVLDACGTAFSVFADVCGAACDLIASFITNVVMPPIQGLVDFVKALAHGDWQGAWDAAVSVVSGFVAGVGQFLSDCVSAIGDFAVDAGTAIAEFVSEFIGKVFEFGANVASAISDNCSQWVSNLGEGLAEGVTTFTQAAVDWVNGFVESITNMIPEAVQGVLNWGKGVVDGFLGFFTGAGKETATTAGNELNNGFQTGVSPMPADTQATLSATQANADAFAGTMGTAGSNAGSGFKTNLDSNLQTAQTNTDTKLNAMKTSGQNFATDMTNKGKEAGTGFEKNLTQNVDKAKTNTDKSLDNMKTSAGNFAKDMSTKGQQAGTDFTNNLDSNLKQSVPKSESTFGNVKTSAEKLKSDMSNTATQTGQQYTTNLNGQLDQAVSGTQTHMSSINQAGQQIVGQMGQAGTQAGSTFTANITSSLQPAVGQASGIGSQIVQGLANGINAGIGWVVSAAKNAVSSAINAAKSLAGIHSPSRVFKDEVGLQLSKGLAEGIKAGGKEAVKNMEDVVTNVTNGAKDALRATEKLTTGFSSSSPNLNTGEVKSLAQQLLNSFGDNPKKLKSELEIMFEDLTAMTENFEIGYVSMMQEGGQKSHDGIIEQINKVKTDLDNILSNITETVSTWTSEFVSSGQTAGQDFKKSLIDDSLALIPEDVKKVVDDIHKAALSLVPMMASAGEAAGKAFADALTSAMSAAMSEAEKLAGEVGAGITSGASKAIEDTSGNVVEGISNMTTTVVNVAKENLKIHSPSRVFRDEVGRFIPEGIAEGIKAYSDKATKQISALSSAMVATAKPVSGALKNTLDNMGNTRQTSNVINFYQTNNSPKALSRKDIYRQTKNALAFVKEV